MVRKKSVEEEEIGCWQYLDCEKLTNLPPEKCPNKKACKQHALYSPNRSCFLPYSVYEKNWLFGVRVLEVSCDEKAQEEAGWHDAEELPYSREKEGLFVKKNVRGLYRQAIDLPFKRDKNSLIVTKTIGDWKEAIALPYTFKILKEGCGLLVVYLLEQKPFVLAELNKCGWYESELLPKFDDKLFSL